MKEKIKKTQKLKEISDHFFHYDPDVFDKDTPLVTKIIFGMWMFLVIGFVMSGILTIIFGLNLLEFFMLLASILIIYLIGRFWGIILAYAFLILIPLIVYLFSK